MIRIATPSSVGDNNKYAILELIKSKDGIGREEIASTLALSAPAVSKNVNVLIEAGIIYEKGTAETQLGRKPALLYFNSRLMYVISIEIMPQGIRGALADFVGNILMLDEMPSNVMDSVDAIMTNVYTLISRLYEKRPFESEVACICAASPGCNEGTTFFNLISTYQEDWVNVDVAACIEERFGIYTILRNDVELDIEGECWRGAGIGYNNILLVKYGDGFACRAMIDGRLYRGANYMAGEIGYFISTVDEVYSNFRSPGVLEQKLSRDIFTQYQEQAGNVQKLPETINFPWLVRQASNGDTVAEKLVRQATDLISIAINNTVLVLNPELIILAGDAGELRNSDVKRISDILERSCPYVPIIKRVNLGKNSGIYGGIKVALHHATKGLSSLWK
jgi:predicted NBD/HSP70 family sugar kinase